MLDFSCLVSEEDREHLKKQIVQREKVNLIVNAVKEACEEMKVKARKRSVPEKSPDVNNFSNIFFL